MATTKPLTVIARIRAMTGKEQEVHQLLVGLVAATRLEEGCLNYDLHVNEDDDRDFFFYETWISHQALECHAGSAHIAEFRRQAEGLLATAPEVIKCWRIEGSID